MPRVDVKTARRETPPLKRSFAIHGCANTWLGVARRAAYHADNHQVKEWLHNGERGPPPSEYTTLCSRRSPSRSPSAPGCDRRA